MLDKNATVMNLGIFVSITPVVFLTFLDCWILWPLPRRAKTGSPNVGALAASETTTQKFYPWNHSGASGVLLVYIHKEILVVAQQPRQN